MNTATRLVHQGVSSRQFALTYTFSMQQMLALVLSFSLLFSALGIIYVTHANRVLYTRYQQALIEADHWHLLHSQLLLEHSALMMPARIEKTAKDKLGMITPENKVVVIIHE